MAAFAFSEYLALVRALIADRSMEAAQIELKRVVEMYIMVSFFLI